MLSRKKQKNKQIKKAALRPFKKSGFFNGGIDEDTGEKPSGLSEEKPINGLNTEERRDKSTDRLAEKVLLSMQK